MEKSVSFDITWSHPCMSALIQRRGPTARARGKKGMSESLRVNFQKEDIHMDVLLLKIPADEWGLYN